MAALQGGTLMSQTLRTTDPLKASMDAALAYVGSFPSNSDEPL